MVWRVGGWVGVGRCVCVCIIYPVLFTALHYRCPPRRLRFGFVSLGPPPTSPLSRGCKLKTCAGDDNNSLKEKKSGVFSSSSVYRNTDGKGNSRLAQRRQECRTWRWDVRERKTIWVSLRQIGPTSPNKRLSSSSLHETLIAIHMAPVSVDKSNVISYGMSCFWCERCSHFQVTHWFCWPCRVCQAQNILL